jgi:hypothetical protein
MDDQKLHSLLQALCSAGVKRYKTAEIELEFFDDEPELSVDQQTSDTPEHLLPLYRNVMSVD